MTIESERLSLRETKTLWERQIGPSWVARREVFLGEELKTPVLYTVLKVLPQARVEIKYDEELINGGVKLGAGGLLIDQEATNLSLGRAAGKLPEVFIAGNSEETVAICPTNFGWQKKAFLIDKGRLVLIRNDREEISGSFGVIGLSQGKWEHFQVDLKKGVPVSLSAVTKLDLGFNLPLILREGEPLSLKEIIDDPRFLADFRNVFDFGVGKELPSNFWLYLRSLMPTIRAAGRRLVEGKSVVVRRSGLSFEQAIAFASIIKDNQLEDWLQVDIRRGIPRISVFKNLPLNRIPVVGVGFDNERRLLVMAVDGRQEKSAGATIQELARLMKAEGAIFAGLGCAGGDVAIVAKTQKRTEVLTSPSNKGQTTRPVPSVLTISP